REATLAEYERVLEQYVFAHFPESLRLTEITPSDIARFVGWLCEPERRLSDKSVRNYVGPVSACLESAKEEGLIRSNPGVACGCRAGRRSAIGAVASGPASTASACGMRSPAWRRSRQLTAQRSQV